MTMPAQMTDFESAQKHASLLADGGPVLLVAILKGHRTLHRRATVAEAWQWIVELQQKGYGIYVTMNDTRGDRRRRVDVVRVRFVWVDDDTPGELRTDWPLEPSFIVRSSAGRYHYVWCTDCDDLDRFDAVMRGMPGDPAARDAARVLRLAGTWNHKRGDMAEIVACSGRRYTWAEIEAGFPPLVVEKHKGGCATHEPARATSALWAIPTIPTGPENYRPWWELTVAAKAAGVPLEEILDWTNDPGKERETIKIWEAIEPDGDIGPGTLYREARAHGWIEDAAVQRVRLDYMLDLPVDVEPIARATEPDRRTALRLMPDLREAVEAKVKALTVEGLPTLPDERPMPPFERNKSGDVLATRDNLSRALSAAHACGVTIAYDTFKESVMVSDRGTWRPLREEDNYNLCRLLEQRLRFKHIGKELMRDGLYSVAIENQFDSAQQWLNRLQWDGTQRVEMSLISYFGAADTPYHRAVARYFWSAAAGRILVPGVKADMTLVAVGEQGAMKSSTIREIAPLEENFAELDLGNRDDDTGRLLRGKTIIELGELKGLRARGAESMKAFLSTRVDRWIPKFFELEKAMPRRFMFFGSTNRHDFLVDETGHRRWLPFESGLCDPDGMARDRDQLWAEARGMFQRGGVDFRQAEALARDQHAKYVEVDPWEAPIAEYLKGEGMVTTARVLGFALNKLPRERSRADEMRVGGILRKLGCERKRARVGGAFAVAYLVPTSFTPLV